MNKSNRLRLYFWVFLALNIVYIVGSKAWLKPLSSGDIVKFEVAKTLPRAEGIIADWLQTGKLEKAKDSIWIDYLFIILYSGLLYTGILLLARSSRHILLMRTGRLISFLIPVAAVCDVIENLAMMKSLAGHPTSFAVALAYDMAIAKFSIIILTLIFLFVCVLFWIGNRFASKPVTGYEL
jgi:hypothetical protein